MHQESRADRSDQDVVKTSKLQKLKNTAFAAGLYGVPAGIVAASTFYGIKLQKTNLEIAKLSLEAARKAAGK